MKYIFVIFMLILLVAPALASNITIITPEPTPEYSYSSPPPTTISPPYLSQGDVVYVNDTVDISGVVPPYPYLAYWNGYDIYDANASYIIDLPPYKSAYYHFYLDPTIFGTRTGNWYKYDGEFEPQGNNLAFVVKPQSMKNSTMRYNNGTLINISETIVNNYTEIEIPIQSPVETKHISDYLIARGDPFKLQVDATTNIWLFGRLDKLLDYKSTNTSIIDINSDILSGFEPGHYTVILQTYNETTNDFTVKYDSSTQEIKWFDPKSFKINSLNTLGLSPQILLDKFRQIIPQTSDTFETYNLELQDPHIEIQSIREIYTQPNQTINSAGNIEYNTNISHIQIKGYTNVAVGSPLKFVVDKDRQTERTISSHTTTAVAGGSRDPGDMRWFDVVVPIDKYNLVPGDHTVTAYTKFSDAGSTYTFTIYTATENSYIPPKTVRYISGKYGPEEFIPTPTPVVQTVTVTVPVTQIVRVEVTPSNEQVKSQQEIIIEENVQKWIIRIMVLTIIAFGVWYSISLYLRRRQLK